jgi:hypothetical protein
MKTRTFDVNIDGKTVSLSVVSPSLEDQREATKAYNTAFSDALKGKSVVRAKLDDLLVDQGLWDEKKQNKFTDLQSQVLEGERKLAKGGISLSEAKKTALEMKKVREELRELISVKTNLDTHTAEGQADNARFNYLVSSCTVYTDTKKRYFSSYDDYINRSADVVTITAAQNLAGMLYGLDADYEIKLPENKFLKDYKFIDEKLRLVNKEGKLVDESGRSIDENGRFINEKGEFVDKDGNIVTKEGDYVFEFAPFLDDQGKPVILEQSKEPDLTKPETQKEPEKKEEDDKKEPEPKKEEEKTK